PNGVGEADLVWWSGHQAFDQIENAWDGDDAFERAAERDADRYRDRDPIGACPRNERECGGQALLSRGVLVAAAKRICGRERVVHLVHPGPDGALVTHLVEDEAGI